MYRSIGGSPEGIMSRLPEKIAEITKKCYPFSSTGVTTHTLMKSPLPLANHTTQDAQCPRVGKYLRWLEGNFAMGIYPLPF